MKKVKIFLASSITDLKLDRLEVGDFVRQLNEIYFDRGVQFFLIKCDDYDNAIASGGKQAELDAEIRASELCFFLFFRKVGEYTRHEFDIALDAFRTSQKPKIVTYFKYVDSPDEAEGSVKAFMQMLDGELRHYYNIYQSIDTLKLGMLMQIKLMGLDAEEPTVENGKVIFGGKTIADTAALPVFAGNKSLTSLKEKFTALTARYYELREKLSSDLDDERTEEEYRKVANEKSETEKAIREAEKGVLETIKSMCVETAKGGLSPRRIAGYRALERGDVAGALEILDAEAIMSDISHYETMREGYQNLVQEGVDELLQRIEVLKVSGTDGSIAEITKLYAAVRECIEKNGLDKTPLLSYVIFLMTHGERDRALEIAMQLEYYYSDPKHPADDERMANLWGVIGGIYAKGARYEEAEEALHKAEKLYKKLVKKQVPAATPLLATVYCDLGTVNMSRFRFKSARNYIKAGLRCLESLAEETFTVYGAELARGYGDLASVDNILDLGAEAEESYKKAIALYEKCLTFDGARRTALEAAEGGVCTNYAMMLINREDMNEADAMFDKAIELLEGPAERDPVAYGPLLAACYVGVGTLNAACEDCEEEAEEAFQYALSFYSWLVRLDPEAYEPLMASVCMQLYELYDEMEDERARGSLNQAISLAIDHPGNALCEKILSEASKAR